MIALEAVVEPPGVSEALAEDAADVPAVFVAVTETVIAVPFPSVARLQVTIGAVAVQVLAVPPSDVAV